MAAATTLVLGLGNDLLSDDGFGPAVAAACQATLAAREDVLVCSAAVAGFNLLDLLAGYKRALIVDVVQTGQVAAGTLMEWPLVRAPAARTLGGSHQMDLSTALALGRSLGYALPGEISLLVAEAADLLTVREQLTPALLKAVPEAVNLVTHWIDAGLRLPGDATPNALRVCPSPQVAST
jgi:hydrogenase maturation protease